MRSDPRSQKRRCLSTGPSLFASLGMKKVSAPVSRVTDTQGESFDDPLLLPCFTPAGIWGCSVSLQSRYHICYTFSRCQFVEKALQENAPFPPLVYKTTKNRYVNSLKVYSFYVIIYIFSLQKTKTRTSVLFHSVIFHRFPFIHSLWKSYHFPFKSVIFVLTALHIRATIERKNVVL